MKRSSVSVSGVIGAIVIISMFCLAPPSAFAADQVYGSVNDYDAGTGRVYGYDGSSWSNTGLTAIDEIYTLSWDRTNNILYASGTTAGAGLVYKREGTGAWTDISPTAGLALATAYSVIKTSTGLYTAGWNTAGDGRVYKYGQTDWESTGLTNVKNAGVLTADSLGNLYVEGMDSTETYGVVNKYSGGTWSPMTLGENIFGDIYGLTVDSANNVYVGGIDFAWENGIVYKYDGTWDDTGLTDFSSVYSLTADGAGNVYAGGQNGSGEGVVSKYSGSWADLLITNGMTNDTIWVESLAVDALGNLYAGGENYLTDPMVYKMVGSTWSDMGVPGADGEVYALGTGYSPDGPPAGVPEPSSMAVSGLAIGLLGLIKRMRRSRK